MVLTDSLAGHRFRLLWIALCFVAGCAGGHFDSAAISTSLRLRDTAGREFVYPDDLRRPGRAVTVVVFFAEHCPTFEAHRERLLRFAKDYEARGVRLVVVDSEVGELTERDARIAAQWSLPPIVIDSGAKLAQALGARYATYSVVFDAEGRIRYRGGFDADRVVLHDDTRRYVQHAVHALLNGREPEVVEGKTLGCALQLR